MGQKGISRRSFLKWSAGALAGIALLGVERPTHAFAAAKESGPAISVSKIPTKPEQIAKESPLVQANMEKLQAFASSLKDGGLQEKVKGVLQNPAPTFLSQYKAGDVDKVYAELQAKGLVDPAKVTAQTLLPPIKKATQTPQPFLTAPGSGNSSHHPYPGGLVTHTTANVTILLGIYHAYEDVFADSCDYDTAVAGEILHDLAKPYVFQWQKDGSSLKEYTIAGTGAHHIFSIAESLYRGMPAEVVVAQACAHNHPGSEKDAADVEHWLQAASILAGKDAVESGLLKADGHLKEPIGSEGFLVHLGDHDWVLSGFAAKNCVAYLKDYAKKTFGTLDDLRFHAFRNYVGSRVSYMRLYQAIEQGEADALIASVVKA